MCVSHDSLLSIVIPRNFVSLTCFIISSPILTSNSAVTIFYLLVLPGLKCIKHHFSIFM